ncbi:MAG TPA: hypothetical protein VIC51_06040, partial [Psychromonas sp.]
MMEEVNKLAKAYEGQTLDQLRAIDKDKLGQIENGRMQVAALEKAIEKKEAVQKFEKENLKNRQEALDLLASKSTAEMETEELLNTA